MPASVVKTAAEEKTWNEAKAKAKEEGHAKDWAYINALFQRMKQGKNAKAAAVAEKKARVANYLNKYD